MKIATYIEFKGNCAEAFKFYSKLFEAEELEFVLFDEEMAEDEKLIGKVFHSELEIQGFYIYMSDSTRNYDMQNQAYSITVECDSLDQATKFYEGLSDSGKIITPLEKMPWGMYLGQVKDSFGVDWAIVFV